MNRKSKKITNGVAFVAVSLVAVFAGLGCYLYQQAYEDSKTTVTGNVTGLYTKWINDQDVFIVTTDVGEFKNVDDYWRDKMDSSRLQGQLTIGQKYRFTVIGWRNNWKSEYPNILSAINLTPPIPPIGSVNREGEIDY